MKSRLVNLIGSSGERQQDGTRGEGGRGGEGREGRGGEDREWGLRDRNVSTTQYFGDSFGGVAGDENISHYCSFSSAVT